MRYQDSSDIFSLAEVNASRQSGQKQPGMMLFVMPGMTSTGREAHQQGSLCAPSVMPHENKALQRGQILIYTSLLYRAWLRIMRFHSTFDQVATGIPNTTKWVVLPHVENRVIQSLLACHFRKMLKKRYRKHEKFFPENHPERRVLSL